ncbi:MAG: molecular chaperone DnaJ, partial [Alphaproteobacteria bacterium]
MQRRSTQSRANFREARPAADVKHCDSVGCAGEGVYPAPRNRAQPRPYLYFCLEHIRAYNAGWDYYRGMNSREIEADRRLDVLWRRPTWALGGKNANLATAAFQFEDPLAAF